MPRAADRIVSKTAADRAGDVWRRYSGMTRQERDAVDSFGDLVDALRTIQAFRNMHGYPLTKVTMGVRSMTRTATRDATLRPGQRHKRLARILIKLSRHSTMRLSQMEDIGGCRVVLPTLEQVYAVAARIHGRWGDEATLTDYIQQPKADGYRGIHIVERRDGLMIEVQLRTEGQDDWARAVEEFGPRLGFDLKDGEGPADLRLYFKLAADRIARGEQGDPPDAAREERFATVRSQVMHYFQR